MRNLLNFLIRYTSWFVFTFYVVISCVLLFQGNPYQHHVYLTSANAVVSGVYDATNSVTGYINLRSINEDLQRRTATLEQEVLDLRHQNKLLHQQLLQDSLRSLPASRPRNFSSESQFQTFLQVAWQRCLRIPGVGWQTSYGSNP